MTIDWKEIAKAVEKYCVEQVVSRLDVATIQKVLKAGIDKLKELASGTSTLIDDWAIETLEGWLNDQAKLEQIRSFLVEKLNHLCTSQEGEEYQILADSLNVCTDGMCGTPAGGKILAKVLEVIFEQLLEYFTK